MNKRSTNKNVKRPKIGDLFCLKDKMHLLYFQKINHDDLLGNLFSVSFDAENVNPVKVFTNLEILSTRFEIDYLDNREVADKEVPQFMYSVHFEGDKRLGFHIINVDSLQRKFTENVEDVENLSPYGIVNYETILETLKSKS